MTYQLWTNLEESSTFFGVESVTPRRSWYHENLVGSRHLLVALGDSWTWGDSLDPNSNENLTNNPDYRLPRTYGRRLAAKLNFDYCMLARCGGSNKECFDRAKIFLPHVTDRYDRILVVATLTEIGREFYDVEWPVGSDEPRWLSCVDDLLQPYEYRMFDRWQKLATGFSNVDLVIARNFTFSYPDNMGFDQLFFVEKNWVQILADRQQKDCYQNDLRVLSWMAFDPLVSYLKSIGVYERLLPNILEIMENMQKAIDWLDCSTLNNKYASKHPTELGHQVWADYLFSEISRLLGTKYGKGP